MSKAIISDYYLSGVNGDKPSVKFFIMDGDTPLNLYMEIVDMSGTNFDNIDFKGAVVAAVLGHTNDPGGLNLGLSEQDIYNLPR